MRSTGLIRRIDNLGRVMIPKEIRRQLGLQEGDSLELYVDDYSIIFKPYYSSISDEISSLLRIIEYTKVGDDDARQKISEILRNTRESIISIEDKKRIIKNYK